MSYRRLDKVLRDIKLLKYQGATAVARATLKAYRDFGLNKRLKKAANWRAEMKAARNYLLRNNRPTEPLAHNGLLFVWQRIRKQPNKRALERATTEFEKLMAETQASISLLGRAIIKTNDKVYTHCHSSTVEQLMVKTFSKRRYQVFASETRPLFQGQITARKLSKHRIPVTIVVDGAGPFLISDTSGKDLMMDSVIIGADALFKDGSVINKIGSYGLTLSAIEQNIPVYIVTSLLKYCTSSNLPIEQRPAGEVWKNAPANIGVINFAFDRVPAKNITWLVTEFGLIKPQQIVKYVKRYYPWIDL